MHEQLLQEIGLTKNEAQIYEALLREGALSAAQIAMRSRVHRRNVYDCLERLLDRGLVYDIGGARERRFEPAPPEEFRSILDAQREKLETEVRALQSAQRQKVRKHRVSIYRGAEGWKNYMRDMLRAGGSAYFIGAKGGWLDSRVRNFFPLFAREFKKRKLRFFHLFDSEVRKAVPEIIPHVGRDYRFLPKSASTKSAVDIFGNSVFVIPDIQLGRLGENIELIVIENKEVADTFRDWYELLWRASGKKQKAR